MHIYGYVNPEQVALECLLSLADDKAESGYLYVETSTGI